MMDYKELFKTNYDKKKMKIIAVFILLSKWLITVNCDEVMNTIPSKLEFDCSLKEDIHFHINRSLHKHGFHRDLNVTLTVTSNKSAMLMLLMKLPLTNAVYIDPYRLRSDGYQVFIDGEIEFEKPAHLSKSITAYIYKNVSTDKNSAVIFDLTLPIHLRYQKPQYEKKFESVIIPKPQIFVKCTGKGKELKKFREDPCDARNISRCFWKEASFSYVDNFPIIQIPIGSKEDMKLVLTVTISVTVISAIYLIYVTLSKPKVKTS